MKRGPLHAPAREVDQGSSSALHLLFEESRLEGSCPAIVTVACLRLRLAAGCAASSRETTRWRSQQSAGDPLSIRSSAPRAPRLRRTRNPHPRGAPPSTPMAWRRPGPGRGRAARVRAARPVRLGPRARHEREPLLLFRTTARSSRRACPAARAGGYGQGARRMAGLARTACVAVFPRPRTPRASIKASPPPWPIRPRISPEAGRRLATASSTSRPSPGRARPEPADMSRIQARASSSPAARSPRSPICLQLGSADVAPRPR